MPAGLEVRNDDGSIAWVTPQDRVGRIIGSMAITSGQYGHIDVPRLPNDKVMAGLLVIGTDVIATCGIVDANDPNQYNLDGGRVVYNFQSGTGTVIVIYGVY